MDPTGPLAERRHICEGMDEFENRCPPRKLKGFPVSWEVAGSRRPVSQVSLSQPPGTAK
jgi:hypothetical protein